MAKELSKIIKVMPALRRARIEKRAEELATLAQIRRAVERTQADLAACLKVGQDTVSRIERNSDMLISTLRRHIEGLGGHLELVARFPHHPPFIIDHFDGEAVTSRGKRAKSAKASRTERPVRT